MARVLILFAHPSLQSSRVQRRLIERAPRVKGVTVHDLYEAYPDYDVDVKREQAPLVTHDLIVWQHPFYWYSTPPLLKQWIDLVLEHGWAYGSKGTALHGKHVLSVISAGGSADAYCAQGSNKFSVRQLLAPLEQTARLCGMEYMPPWVVFGTHRLTTNEVRECADRYEDLLRWLVAGGFKDVDASYPGTLQDVSECRLQPPVGTRVPTLTSTVARAGEGEA
ncbi:MAG: NAD(P)H-dependent oxidoreductase [Myxococcota bacterium]